MAGDRQFLDFVLDQMAPVAEVRARAMFGGHGLYWHGRIFAIVLDDRLYLKSDAGTRLEFEARALTPFRYESRGRRVTTRYFEAPAEVFEDSDAMREWVRKACDAASRAGTCKARGRPHRQD
jgi:DNA transformation protein and related proteins